MKINKSKSGKPVPTPKQEPNPNEPGIKCRHCGEVIKAQHIVDYSYYPLFIGYEEYKTEAHDSAFDCIRYLKQLMEDKYINFDDIKKMVNR